jgi:hypothetical protein
MDLVSSGALSLDGEISSNSIRDAKSTTFTGLFGEDLLYATKESSWVVLFIMMNYEIFSSFLILTGARTAMGN